MATASQSPEPRKPRRPPAKTLEGRENQLISLAIDLAERQLSEGTASAQVITHYLKQGTVREQLEQERLRRDNILLEAKANSMASSERMEILYEQAIKAMRGYAGQELEEEYDED